MRKEIEDYIIELNNKTPEELCEYVRNYPNSSTHNLTTICVNAYEDFCRLLDKIAEVDKDLEMMITHAVMCNMAGIG